MLHGLDLSNVARLVCLIDSEVMSKIIAKILRCQGKDNVAQCMLLYTYGVADRKASH